MQLMHRFRDMTTYWSKIAEKTYPTLIWHVPLGDHLRIFRRLIPCQKLESWGNQVVYISRSCFRSARHNMACDGRTSGRTDRQTRRCRSVARVKSNSWARTRGAQLTAELGPARTQQKTSALGKPDADLFIARTY